MIRGTIFAICWILFSCLTLSAQSWKIYPYHKEGTLIYFPADEGAHTEFAPGYGTEWWYVNMHLEGESTHHRYSAMLAIFNYQFRIFDMADETAQEFHSSTDLGSLSSSGTALNLVFTAASAVTDRWYTKEDSAGHLLPFQYHVQTGDELNNVNVNLDAQKPPLIIGDDGLVTVGSGDSYYYSQTLLTVTGSLTFNNSSEPVSGTAWIDHQYGPFFLAPGQDESYEWFSVQLDNGMDLNIWNIFNKQDRIPADDSHRICTVYIDDQTQDTTSAFILRRKAFWEYDDGRFFSSGWQFIDPEHDIDLTIIPVLRNQVVPFILAPFWEGSCRVKGVVEGDSVKGQSFAELLHIYENPQIRLISPNVENLWDGSQPVSWTLKNPDGGNPLKYDLFYRQGRNGVPQRIVSALSDTSSSWDVSGLVGMDSCVLIVAGYSVDSTITAADTSDQMFSIVPPLSIGSADDSKTYQYKLYQNYPNPFNPSTHISFSLPQREHVVIDIYNTIGQYIKTVKNQVLNAGYHELVFDGQNLSSGIYFYRIEAGTWQEIKKMILIK
jgi:predicted secreted hydrolase